jgi:hypothetical protein
MGYIAMIGSHEQSTKAKRLSVFRLTSNTRGPRTKDQGLDWSGEKVQLTASLQIPEDQGPRTRLKWRECAVFRLTSNTRGPSTKAQIEVERRCSLQHHFKYQRTKDQGPDWIWEKVQFTAFLQIPEDQGPRTKLKWREGAVFRLISNTRGPKTTAQTEVESKCSLQGYFKFQLPPLLSIHTNF